MINMKPVQPVAPANAKGETLRPDETAPRLAPTAVPASFPNVPGYELLGVVGRGSMGVVYKARHASLNRLVAIKMIRQDSHFSSEELQRFVTEARVVASMRHQNIIQIYDIDLEHESPHFSMELIDGGTLADYLAGRPQPARETAQLVLTLARAMHQAHSQGIVHRDLKPANILIAAPDARLAQLRQMADDQETRPPDLFAGTPKITDFGLAKELYGEASQTESDIILGTPSYMAPEQAEGKSRDVGPGADIYALGAILYEMLTGRPPFAAESRMETILLLFQAEPVAPSVLQPKIPRDLETICLKCLHKDPSRRYGSAQALAEDLQCFLFGEPIQARPTSVREKTWKWMRRRPVLATLLACSILASVTLLGLAGWHQVELQTRLGQALADERETRLAQAEAAERERLMALRDRVKDMLRAGEAAISSRDWQEAEVQLARARDQAGDEALLADLRTHIENRLAQASRRRANHERVEAFWHQRNEAMFHATLFTGGKLASALQETRIAAWKALDLFGADATTKRTLHIDGEYLSEQQQQEIAAGCYELVIILADATAHPLPNDTRLDLRRRAEEALSVLDLVANKVATQAYHRRRADLLTQAGQAEAAAQELRLAETTRPASALDHFLLGQEQYGKGDCQKAAAAFEHALQLQADHFWAGYYLAVCRLKTQRADQAVACLTACLAQRREFPWLYLLRASAWAELNQFDHADADFTSALKSDLPASAQYGLLINRGVMRIRQNRLTSATRDLEQAIKLRPSEHQGYVNLAQAHLKAEQTTQALVHLDEAIRLEPEIVSLYRTRARVRLMVEDHAGALGDLVEAIRRDGGIASDYAERSRILQTQGDLTGALTACDEALRLRSSDARCHRLRAELLLALKRMPEAVESLDACLAHGTRTVDVYCARAKMRMQLGQYAGAQADYTRALEFGADAAVHAGRGWAYLVADAPKLALADFEAAIKLAPDRGDAYAGRGFARVLLGDHRAAAVDADAALKHGPESPRLCYNVARIYAQGLARLALEPARYTRAAENERDAWQARAFVALAKSMSLQSAAEAAEFWQNVVRTDKALEPLRRSPRFAYLAERYTRKIAKAE